MQGKQLSQMLDEDPALMERRTQIAKRLELYRAARDEIDAVAWLKWVFALGHHREIPHQFQDITSFLITYWLWRSSVSRCSDAFFVGTMQWIETNIIIICQVCWREWNQKCFNPLNWCENWWPCRKLDSFLNWDCSFHLNGHRYLSYKYSVVWFFFSQGPELLQFIVWKAICWEIHSFISVAKGTLLWLLFQVTLVWCLLVW